MADAVDEHVAYTIGAYGYGADPGTPDRGMFILTLRRAEDGRWLVAADLDGVIRPRQARHAGVAPVTRREAFVVQISPIMSCGGRVRSTTAGGAARTPGK